MGKRGELLVDLLLFFATVALAAWYRWSVTDLIWSLWIASLTLGYTFILASIVGMILNPPKGQDLTTQWRKRKGAARAGLVVQVVIGVGFVLGFFSFHFLFFHFAHAHFLEEFFPMDGARSAGLRVHMGPFRWDLVQQALANYWSFIAVSIPSRLSDYRRTIRKPGGSGVLFKPYINVVRMHIMIFIFAALHGLGLRSFAVYPVLILYFLPYAAAARWLKERERKSPDNEKGAGRASPDS